MSVLFGLPTISPDGERREPVTIAAAKSVDRAAVMSMLLDANLPLDGIVEHFGHVLVARGGDGALAGVIGLELYGASALIRSVAVAPAHRRQGLGRRLVEAIIARAKCRGVGTLYLLTEGARPFFEAMGFEPIEREEVDPHVAASPQFRGAPCRAATCLKRTI